jgi:hypothetical protein
MDELELRREELTCLRVPERIRLAVQLRLQMLAPYIGESLDLQKMGYILQHPSCMLLVHCACVVHHVHLGFWLEMLQCAGSCANC